MRLVNRYSHQLGLHRGRESAAGGHRPRRPLTTPCTSWAAEFSAGLWDGPATRGYHCGPGMQFGIRGPDGVDANGSARSFLELSLGPRHSFSSQSTGLSARGPATGHRAGSKPGPIVSEKKKVNRAQHVRQALAGPRRSSSWQHDASSRRHPPFPSRTACSPRKKTAVSRVPLHLPLLLLPPATDRQPDTPMAARLRLLAGYDSLSQAATRSSQGSFACKPFDEMPLPGDCTHWLLAWVWSLQVSARCAPSRRRFAPAPARTRSSASAGSSRTPSATTSASPPPSRTCPR